MTIWEQGLLFIAALFAGAMNAVAGGGTIITFPLLIALGVPSIAANATSTVGLLFGITGSLWGYRSHIAVSRRWILAFAPVSVLGGALGAWLLTITKPEVFDKLVPFLIFSATILFLLNDAVRRLAGVEAVATSRGRSWILAAMTIQLFVAIYGGYFGAGIGILMLAALGLIGLHHIHQMNAIKTVLGALINVVAAAWFIAAGLVQWKPALVMTLGSAIGYYSSSRISQRIPQRHVRTIIAVIGLALSAVFFWREFVSR